MDKTMREVMRQRADAAKAERLRKLKEDREAFYASKRKPKVSKEERAQKRIERANAIQRMRDGIKRELAEQKAKNKASCSADIEDAKRAFRAECIRIRSECIAKDRAAVAQARKRMRDAPKYIDKNGAQGAQHPPTR